MLAKFFFRVFIWLINSLFIRYSKIIEIFVKSLEILERGMMEGGNIAEILAHHIVDTPLLVSIGVTKHVVILWMVAFILMVVMIYSAKKIVKERYKPSRYSSFMEVIIEYIRDDVVYPNLGEEDGKRWLPFFLTMFFFILFANLSGLIPFSSTPTGNIAVTGGLALITLICMVIGGMIKQGVMEYWKNLVPGGIPLWVSPILFLIEFIGLIAKPFALTIRLFANMIAGHIVIIVLLFLIVFFNQPLIALGSVPGAVIIYLLEIFIAFIQAYIFTILSALFIGASLHPEH